MRLSLILLAPELWLDNIENYLCPAGGARFFLDCVAREEEGLLSRKSEVYRAVKVSCTVVPRP